MTNRLMLFMETIDVYCENHTEHGQNTGILNDKARGTYSYHCDLES
jgi:hypothetical protein